MEVIRDDNPVDTLGVFTISQSLAIALSLAGLLGLIWLRRFPPRSPKAVLWEEPEEKAKTTTKAGKGEKAASSA
jgi:hypothetical protein